jgi:hypothetical protein
MCTVVYKRRMVEEEEGGLELGEATVAAAPVSKPMSSEHG